MFIDGMFRIGNILLEIKLGNHLTELLSLKQESNVCIVYHNNYFTCTPLNSDKKSARAIVVGNGKSPEREVEGGFLGQTIWMGRYCWILPIYE